MNGSCTVDDVYGATIALPLALKARSPLPLVIPRMFGYVFNPLTVYFCHAADGELRAILYEVNNTFGERHSYLIPAEDAPIVKQACDKGFYVSPFMDMELSYASVRPYLLVGTTFGG